MYAATFTRGQSDNSGDDGTFFNFTSDLNSNGPLVPCSDAIRETIIGRIKVKSITVNKLL